MLDVPSTVCSRFGSVSGLPLQTITSGNLVRAYVEDMALVLESFSTLAIATHCLESLEQISCLQLNVVMTDFTPLYESSHGSQVRVGRYGNLAIWKVLRRSGGPQSRCYYQFESAMDNFGNKNILLARVE